LLWKRVLASRCLAIDYSGFQAHCSLLEAAHLNSLLVCHGSFFSKVSARDVFLWLGFSCGDYSPTTPTAPSSRTLILSGSLIRFQSIQVHHHYPKLFFSKRQEQNYPKWLVLLHFQLISR
jgi:hypothetical protein